LTDTTVDPAAPPRPVPLPYELSAGYWTRASGQLAIQRCGNCRRWHHPPVVCCTACRSRALAFEDVSGRGAVYQRVIVHQTKLPAFEAATPYVAATIELDEQPGLFVVANVVGVAPDRVRIGDRVRVIFERIAEGITLPQFTPDDRAAS
jgi:uncharacterized protein